MLGYLRRALERRRSVRGDAARLVKLHGRRAAEIAFNRSDEARGRDAGAQRYWRDVARFALSWEAHLSMMDTPSRNRLIERYARH